MSAVKIVIVGGVAGGMSAAARARRMNESASIIVLEKGGYVSFANCGMPYYLAGRIEKSEKLLVTTPQVLRERFNIDARVRNEVTEVDRERKRVTVVDHGAGGWKYELEYDKLILAPGAAPIVPAIDHVRAENVFLLRQMEDALGMETYLKTAAPKHVVIVGAGFIGLEVAEAMRDRGLGVTVVEKSPHALPPLDAELAPFVHQELAAHGVDLVTGVGLKALREGGKWVSGVVLEDGREIAADVVLLSIGVRPNVKLAADAGLRIGASGAIAVDDYQRTSDPDVYAVGDAAEVVHGVTQATTRIPLAGPANRQGRVAGEHAATGCGPRMGAVLGTAVVRVFDLTVAVTGLGEEAARRAAFKVDTAYAVPASHATYYPGAEVMRLKLIYDRPSGLILGAQAVGGEGVDKRIDVIATAMHFHGTVDDLAGLDLAYAPQVGSAKDAVHMAAFVAQNQRRELVRAVDPGKLDGQVLVDVRTPGEYAKGALAGAVNIPLEELRSRADELDPRRDTVVYCQVGQRGYAAQRILSQRGFRRVVNLKGGYALASVQG